MKEDNNLYSTSRCRQALYVYVYVCKLLIRPIMYTYTNYIYVC